MKVKLADVYEGEHTLTIDSHEYAALMAALRITMDTQDTSGEAGYLILDMFATMMSAAMMRPSLD